MVGVPRRKNERPQLDIPAEDERIEQWRKRKQQEERPRSDRDDENDSDERPKRGVMIIDFG